ncbi:hypothetical protein LOD99_13374 [Oopsacas minuta]|uniref:Uncharacterized protein n=1 Tax=Oopsacas minuta TaxID=111878 RepID=A0AAV7KKP1_9METZ|nr:hypothetical protein LOD99_13374 [Oopsacas minuta]
MKRIVVFPSKDSPSYQFSQDLTLPSEFQFDPSKSESKVSVFELLCDLKYKELDEYFKTGDPNVFDSCGYSLINRCIQYHLPRPNTFPKHDGMFYDMLVYLLDHGCNVNLQKTHRGRSSALLYVLNPVLVGSEYNDFEKLREIQSFEARNKVKEPERNPILTLKRKIGIIKLLLDRGSLNISDSYGFNPVMIAVNLAARMKSLPKKQSEIECYEEISELLLSHFSLTIRNIIEVNLQYCSRLQLISVKHGLDIIYRTHNLVSKLNQSNIKLRYNSIYEMSHQFFISEEKSLEVNEELKSLLFVMQYFDLANFLSYFRIKGELNCLGKSPLKSSLNFVFTSPQIWRLEIFSVDCFLLYLDNANILNWILPYKIDGSLSKIEGVFSLFQYLISKPEFDVSQIGPFFIDLISRIESNSELASGIKYLLVRLLILLELWVLHRPFDESKVYHLKEDLIRSQIFTFNTLAHYFLQNFNLFDIIHIKTSYPVQRGEIGSVWEKGDEMEKQNVNRNAEHHIFMRILGSLSFQVNNRDETEKNTCLHILAKLGRVNCMEYLLDYLGAYPFALNSQGITFLDIYEGMNGSKTGEEKDTQVLKNINQFRQYTSKPYSLRTLSGYILSKLPNEIIKSMNPPHNILHFISLHQQPKSAYEVIELTVNNKGKYQVKSNQVKSHPIKSHRKFKPKVTTDKQASPSDKVVSFTAFSVKEGDTDCGEYSCSVKFNPGIL